MNKKIKRRKGKGKGAQEGPEGPKRARKDPRGLKRAQEGPRRIMRAQSENLNFRGKKQR
jgi:hypothetical protein